MPNRGQHSSFAGPIECVAEKPQQVSGPRLVWRAGLILLGIMDAANGFRCKWIQRVTVTWGQDELLLRVGGPYQRPGAEGFVQGTRHRNQFGQVSRAKKRSEVIGSEKTGLHALQIGGLSVSNPG